MDRIPISINDMVLFFLILILELIPNASPQSFISAYNASYPFRLGQKTVYSISTNNDFPITLDYSLDYTPKQCFISITAHNNPVSGTDPNIKLKTDTHGFSKTGFSISLESPRPNDYSLLSFTYCVFDPSYNTFIFYATGFVKDSSKEIKTSNIGNQSLSTIKTIAIRSIEIQYAIASYPYTFSSDFNGTHVVITFNSYQISKVYFDVTIITLNSSATEDISLNLKWNIGTYNITENTHTVFQKMPYDEHQSVIYNLIGLKGFKYYYGNHLTWRFQQQALNNFSYVWQTNKTFVYFTFVVVSFSIEKCSNPLFPYLLYRYQRCYDACPGPYLGDEVSMRCYVCVIQDCRKCESESVCEECEVGFSVRSGGCVACSLDAASIDYCGGIVVPVDPVQPQEPQQPVQPEQPEQPVEPQEPQEPEEEPSNCRFVGNNTNCAASQLSINVAVTFTSVVSVPTINLMTSAFSNIIGLFDDFSYYCYHNRVYSKQVIVYFQLANSFTLSRFFPPQLQGFLDKVDISYSQNILPSDLSLTPAKFKELDGDVYFLKNMDSFFIGTIIISSLAFTILALVNYLTNKCFKHKLLKKYNYIGMFFVSLFAGNIQYISFRCFEQIYQTVPISPMHYGNLIVCYGMLLFVVLFSISGITLFRSVYHKVKAEYVEEELFEASVTNWFILSNLLKITNGFIHAYFHDSTMLQQGLLTVSYGVKAGSYFFLVHKWPHKLMFIFEMACNCLMLTFQCFVFVELFLINAGGYTGDVESQIGEVEFSLLISLFILQILAPILQLIQSLIISLKDRYFWKPPKILPDVFILKQKSKNTTRSNLVTEGYLVTQGYLSSRRSGNSKQSSLPSRTKQSIPPFSSKVSTLATLADNKQNHYKREQKQNQENLLYPRVSRKRHIDNRRKQKKVGFIDDTLRNRGYETELEMLEIHNQRKKKLAKNKLLRLSDD